MEPTKEEEAKPTALPVFDISSSSSQTDEAVARARDADSDEKKNKNERWLVKDEVPYMVAAQDYRRTTSWGETVAARYGLAIKQSKLELPEGEDRGVFTSRDLEVGETVCDVAGRFMFESSRQHSKSNRLVALQRLSSDGQALFINLIRYHPSALINDGAHVEGKRGLVNVEFYERDDVDLDCSDFMVVRANRPIKSGEELYLDYGRQYFSKEIPKAKLAKEKMNKKKTKEAKKAKKAKKAIDDESVEEYEIVDEESNIDKENDEVEEVSDEEEEVVSGGAAGEKKDGEEKKKDVDEKKKEVEEKKKEVEEKKDEVEEKKDKVEEVGSGKAGGAQKRGAAASPTRKSKRRRT